jgi:hypothetical protein
VRIPWAGDRSSMVSEKVGFAMVGRYIQRSKGEIRTVVGVNLNDIYRKKRRKGAKTASADAPATFSIWRAEFDNSNGQTRVSVKNSVRDQVHFPLILQSTDYASDKIEQVFRNQDGNHVPSVGLQLSLKDFVCENVVGSFGEVENPQLVLSGLGQQFLEASAPVLEPKGTWR